MLACIREAATLGPGTGRWPGLNAWYLPLATKGQMQRRCLHPERLGLRPQRPGARAGHLRARVGQALWRLKLAAVGARRRRSSHSGTSPEHVPGSHFARLSHALAAIMGAASSLQTQRDKLAPRSRSGLLGRSSARRAPVHRTENTLQLVRLDNAGELIWTGSPSRRSSARCSPASGSATAAAIKSNVPGSCP